MSKYKQIDLSKIKTYSINDRSSKVNISAFAQKYQTGARIDRFIDCLPDILIGKDFKKLVAAIVNARRQDKQVIVMMGAHVIKCGLSPLIIQLMEEGIITCVALNGAGVIHDVEIANWGNTSEDVGEAVNNGSFGMVRETPQFIFEALTAGKKSKAGFGEAVGQKVESVNSKYKQLSLTAAGFRLNIPVTVHVAIGTDIIHQHPQADGAIIGDLSYRDFKIFCQQVSGLDKQSVVLNFGSAVILPEIFLKALTVVRNLGHDAHGFTTANFDMIRHYRPQVNVVQRPTQTGGVGYDFVGHHEIMIPLLTAAVLDALWSISDISF